MSCVLKIVNGHKSCSFSLTGVFRQPGVQSDRCPAFKMGSSRSRSWATSETHWHCCHEGLWWWSWWQSLATNKQSHQANCLTQDGNIAVSDYDNKWISIHEPNGKFVSKVIFRLDLSSENPKLKYFYRLEFRKFKAKIFSPIVGREQASWSKGHRSRRVRRTNCDRQ